MVCVTWGDMRGLSKKVTDKDLLELLEDLRNLSGTVWELEEFTTINKRIFRKPIIQKRYSLYAECGPEWQVINHVGNGDWSINQTVTKAQVGSLMVGYRMGFYDGRKPALPNKEPTP